jgi:hypothetical protein
MIDLHSGPPQMDKRIIILFEVAGLSVPIDSAKADGFTNGSQSPDQRFANIAFQFVDFSHFKKIHLRENSRSVWYSHEHENCCAGDRSLHSG